jgi:hypothetical protein
MESEQFGFGDFMLFSVQAERVGKGASCDNWLVDKTSDFLSIKGKLRLEWRFGERGLSLRYSQSP